MHYDKELKQRINKIYKELNFWTQAEKVFLDLGEEVPTDHRQKLDELHRERKRLDYHWKAVMG